ncbi:CU044_2847 family protein [Belnapia sp. F-4-1]|uniref:CU044_2847 family protein n=1 Tax=Belnapia sp. F-4-1 TaxID=1545443 RepID=UPI00350E960E
MVASRRFVTVTVDSNQSPILFEASDGAPTGQEDSWQDVGASSRALVEGTTQAFDQAVNAIKPIAARVAEGLRSLGPECPAEIELTLSIKLSGKVGFFIAESQGEGSIGLKLRWKA